MVETHRNTEHSADVSKQHSLSAKHYLYNLKKKKALVATQTIRFGQADYHCRQGQR